MNREILYIIIFITSVFISSISQILLKKSANSSYSSRLKEYVNFKVIIAYAMFFASTLLTIVAYRVIPLSLGPILESTGYIFVSILGMLFLNEKIKVKKLIGMIIIILGIILFSI